MNDQNKKHPLIILIIFVFGFIGLLSVVFLFGTINGIGIDIPFLEPGVITDTSVTPASHARLGIVADLPGSGTYCINAETLSRGEPVIVGLHYRVPTETPTDRFSEPIYIQGGATFTTDNTHVVNETVTVPENAIDSIITVSYAYYVSDNRVHIKIKKCG